MFPSFSVEIALTKQNYYCLLGIVIFYMKETFMQILSWSIE